MMTGATSTSLRTAVILAGGLGTRLRSEVADVPKPMAPVGGRPFLEHQMQFWIGQGISRFVLSVGYKRDVIISHFGRAWGGAVVDYAIEEEPLGTGGGVLVACAQMLDAEPFLLLNGDTFFAVSLADLYEQHVSKAADLTVALFKATESGRYGRADLDADDRLRLLASEPAEKGEYANGGIYCLTKQALAAWLNQPLRKLSFETDILPQMLRSHQKLVGFRSDAAFIDIGIPDDWRRASEVIGAVQ